MGVGQLRNRDRSISLRPKIDLFRFVPRGVAQLAVMWLRLAVERLVLPPCDRRVLGRAISTTVAGYTTPTNSQASSPVDARGGAY